MNLASADPVFVSTVLSEAVSGLNPSGEEVAALHFYAAGLITNGDTVPENAAGIDPVLRKTSVEQCQEVFPYKIPYVWAGAVVACDERGE